MEILSALSNVATIATAVVAIGTAVYFWYQRYARRKRLEKYLADESAESFGVGPARRIPHLMAECLMTEEQLFVAALQSEKINVWDAVDDEGQGTGIIMFSIDPRGRKLKDGR